MCCKTFENYGNYCAIYGIVPIGILLIFQTNLDRGHMEDDSEQISEVVVVTEQRLSESQDVQCISSTIDHYLYSLPP